MPDKRNVMPDIADIYILYYEHAIKSQTRNIGHKMLFRLCVLALFEHIIFPITNIALVFVRKFTKKSVRIFYYIIVGMSH